MPWFNVDDGFWAHPKTLQIGDSAQALWLRAGSWAMANLTDGFIPDYALTVLGGKPKPISELVGVGLWIKVKAGYQFKDWGSYQRSKEQIENERTQSRERIEKFREAKKKSRSNAVSNAVTPTVTDGVANGDVTPVVRLPNTNTNTKLTVLKDSLTDVKNLNARESKSVEYLNQLSWWIDKTRCRDPLGLTETIRELTGLDLSRLEVLQLAQHATDRRTNPHIPVRDMGGYLIGVAKRDPGEVRSLWAELEDVPAVVVSALEVTV